MERGEEVVLKEDDVDEGEDQGNAETKAVAPGVHGTRKSKGTKSKVVVVVAAVMESLHLEEGDRAGAEERGMAACLLLSRGVLRP